MEHPTGHAERVARLVEEFHAIPRDAPVRLAKKTSNLFRPRAKTAAPGLDVGGFTNVLHVDPVARTASVEGMVTYEKLVDATLPYGLMPLVVPQLKTITLGGAVTGLGIESSSFRNGCPHESVTEMEILTGDGRVIVAPRRQTSTPTSSTPSRTPTARSATRCAWRSSWSRSSPSSPCGTCASASPAPSSPRWNGSAENGPWTPARSTSSTAPCSPATSCT